MRKFGLIGKSLSHSFSKEYFENKWNSLNIKDCIYNLYELNSIQEVNSILYNDSDIIGLNITIPYKELIIKYLDGLSDIAKEICAVNCIKNYNGKWLGYNTDVLAFRDSLDRFLNPEFKHKALLLGTGGASKAVQWVLKDRGIEFQFASRSGNGISYKDLDKCWDPDWKLIINTSPVGMWPDQESFPDIPYHFLDKSHYLYDLVYNPEKSLFLTLGAQQGSKIKNGIEMLHLQADYSWHYWNE